MRRSTLVILIISSVLLLDQSIKIWVKMNMYLNQEFSLLGIQWLRIHFTENEGMAFGLTLSGSYGKLSLSVFRIVAVAIMGYYLTKLVKTKASKGLIISLSFIFAGAMGNILDSAFYGLFFSSSYHGVATFLPEAGGYANFLHGHVVDMFYLPMWKGIFPSWFPFFGGEPFLFFRSIFNIADLAITLGVVLIIFFQGSFFRQEVEQQESDSSGIAITTNDESNTVRPES